MEAKTMSKYPEVYHLLRFAPRAWRQLPGIRLRVSVPFSCARRISCSPSEGLLRLMGPLHADFPRLHACVGRNHLMMEGQNDPFSVRKYVARMRVALLCPWLTRPRNCRCPFLLTLSPSGCFESPRLLPVVGHTLSSRAR